MTLEPDGIGDAPEDGRRRISVSLQTLRQEIENATLRLQLELQGTFAAKDDLERVEAALEEFVKASGDRLDQIEANVTELDTDKAGREAVQAYKRWLTGGALISLLILAANLVISMYLVLHHGYTGK